MAISRIVCRGYGSFGGGVNQLPTRGYSVGAPVSGGGGGGGEYPLYLELPKPKQKKQPDKPKEKPEPKPYVPTTRRDRGTITLPTWELTGTHRVIRKPRTYRDSGTIEFEAFAFEGSERCIVSQNFDPMTFMLASVRDDPELADIILRE